MATKGLAELFKKANVLPTNPQLGDYYATPSSEGMNFFSEVASPAMWFVAPGRLGKGIGATLADMVGTKMKYDSQLKQVGEQGFNMGWINPFLK